MIPFARRQLLSALLALAFPLAHGATASPELAPLRLRIAVVESAATGLDSQALLPLGSLAATPGAARRAAIVRRERVAIRLDGTASHARLSVALAMEMPGCTVRVDGQTVTAIPRIVDPVHRVGATVVHELEFFFDAGVPAGSFLSNLQWTAESD